MGLLVPGISHFWTNWKFWKIFIFFAKFIFWARGFQIWSHFWKWLREMSSWHGHVFLRPGWMMGPAKNRGNLQLAEVGLSKLALGRVKLGRVWLYCPMNCSAWSNGHGTIMVIGGWDSRFLQWRKVENQCTVTCGDGSNQGKQNLTKPRLFCGPFQLLLLLLVAIEVPATYDMQTGIA